MLAASPSGRVVWLLAALLLWLGGGAAQAQIVREKPAQVKAANRRALREAKRTESPFKDSHLDVTPARLKRGQSTQPQAQVDQELCYKGTAPGVKPAGFLGLRRDKTTTVVRKEQRTKPRNAGQGKAEK
ncbi:hypothetical protein JAO73_07890 [Hymenobacter sp. BT523]|uniref:hypothetical protein n=1 Tax=Hymenobacter sp. BT523 TaxID=2795725 RepID=UPI0018EBB622|nr:hypothetical protein [Hymenobacter sp. BT523]MBJ6108925.1 hypothetical protein [Hymenobacter sp. BT523]